MIDEILGDRPSNSSCTYTFNVGAATAQSSTEEETPTNVTVPVGEALPAEKNPLQNKKDKDLTETSQPSTSKGIKKRRNYSQDFYKTKLEFLKQKETERKSKEERHRERMDIERKRNELEERKLALLEAYLTTNASKQEVSTENEENQSYKSNEQD